MGSVFQPTRCWCADLCGLYCCCFGLVIGRIDEGELTTEIFDEWNKIKSIFNSQRINR